MSRQLGSVPPEQQAIQDRCFHHSGTFIEFEKAAIEQSIPDRFEEQVRRYPQRLAIKTENQELTYDELNKAANRVAHAILEQRGEGHEPIALMFEPGAQAIVGILGVMKAGKIFVYLDPSYPLSRHNYILTDSQAALLVTNRQNLPLAEELAHFELPTINIEELASSFSIENPCMPISPDSLLYILYTSGSTGEPKGVVQNHRNRIYEAVNLTNGLHICAEDRVALMVSGSGYAVMIILSALLTGAALYPFDIQMAGLAKLGSWLVREQVTVWHVLPSVFRGLCSESNEEHSFANIRLIVLSGEPVYAKEVELYKRQFSDDCILVNRLGIAETGTIRYYIIDKNTPVAASTVPVGYHYEGMEVHLLDDDGRQVVLNQAGEIAVRSRYLSPGYWRRPDLTQAAFLPDPDGGDQRIYLTGDLGRLLPDGCLEHLGRKDFQLKIRGYRVEAAEVEMALLDRTDVSEAVVVAREDRPGKPRLVAYLVPSGQPVPTISSLRSSLQKSLPEYMVPSIFVFLDALPTLPNGKLDRQGLPAPGGARPELETTLVGGRTPVERVLLEVWTEVLGLDEIGVHDNFLELGGDSLLAGQVVSRVISEFRVELPLRSLFQAPTVADMALAITQRRAKATDQADIDRMLAELEALSGEETKQLLAEETKSNNQIGR